MNTKLTEAIFQARIMTKKSLESADDWCESMPNCVKGLLNLQI